MANISGFQVYSDASGAPALVTVNGYTWSFDTLGDVTCNMVRPSSGSRSAQKVALSIARKAYLDHRDGHVDAEWLRRNRELYAV